MNWKSLLLVFVIVGFAALTAWALVEHGYIGIFTTHLQTAAGMQVLADLVIALSLALVWMVRDARERGVSALPWVVATLALGSFGPLLYLLARERSSALAPRPARA